MCKNSVFISCMVVLTLCSLTWADINQSQSSSVGVSTDPVATNWAVSQYSNGDSSSVGTQTQTINVYTSSSDSDSLFLGSLPSSLAALRVGTQSVPALLNGSILLAGLGGSPGLSAATQNFTTLPLLLQLSSVSGLSGVGAFNPVSSSLTFP